MRTGHWTEEVLAFADIINVVLLKDPPRYTYQLSSFKAQDSSGQQKRQALTLKISKTHKEHAQEDARAVIE
ncbi:hypothetical protein PHMEG_00021854 [Phytophthora megakarya]|uniref:Uncharacterized protein n=1 Tax=Phytophthora megakarya TaxID=4795 RepID=A0A225VLJ0_9STRA|nr:hypothetical protein PHMEG_00021854 [Phytophthora megakarya]